MSLAISSTRLLLTTWLDYPGPKTAIERKSPLWPETVEAVQEAISQSPKPLQAENKCLVFITRYRNQWGDNAITKEMRKLLDKLNLYRPGLGFYALRHTFETIAGETRDQVAVNHIMGHSDSTMAGVYRECIFDERLLADTDFIRGWLFKEGENHG